jgi:hypothetical protein
MGCVSAIMSWWRPSVLNIRLGLPPELRRSIGCTNAIENLIAVLRQVCRNVKRWRNARMALRWTGTAMLEAEKSFRRLKAHKQLPVPRCCAISKHCSVTSPLPAKTGLHRIQPMALLHQFQQAPGLSGQRLGSNVLTFDCHTSRVIGSL